MVERKKQQQSIQKVKKNDKCFQYTITVALNYQQTNNHPEKI